MNNNPSFEDIKAMMEALFSVGAEPELGLSLNDKDYVITLYPDNCTFCRCGINDSEEALFDNLDSLFGATTIDGICLERDWDRIKYFTIEDNNLDEFEYIMEAYKESSVCKKRLYERKRLTDTKHDE